MSRSTSSQLRDSRRQSELLSAAAVRLLDSPHRDTCCGAPTAAAAADAAVTTSSTTGASMDDNCDRDAATTSSPVEQHPQQQTKTQSDAQTSQQRQSDGSVKSRDDRPITSKFAPHRVTSANSSPQDGATLSRGQSPAAIGNEAEFFSR